MTLFRHEFRQGLRALAVWTASAAALLAACVLLFPEMKGEMDEAGALFASMGGFTAAFGMDRLDLGTLSGYYALECGSVLSFGCAFFAAQLGAQALSKEEQGGTAEFLLSHPVSRTRIAAEKLAAVAAQIACMSAALLVAALLSVAAAGEAVPWETLLPLHLACFLLQIELACVCFGVSAFLRRGGAGVGIGLAAALYLLNLVSNLSPRARFLKWLTPFAYCDGADIASSAGLDGARVAAGMLAACAGVAAAMLRWRAKDIR